jgi:hypothetical protein
VELETAYAVLNADEMAKVIESTWYILLPIFVIILIAFLATGQE